LTTFRRPYNAERIVLHCVEIPARADASQAGVTGQSVTAAVSLAVLRE